jgi:Secretion system C-terminal sorting domain
MVFKNTQYTRTDHYSPVSGLVYQFTNAQLQWINKGNNVYLCGNVQMHSPRRNEPQKPQYVALTRQAAGNGTGNITLTNADGSEFSITNDLLAYPNPFTDVVTIDFELKEACEVQTQLLTLDGNIVYSNKAGLLEAGKYTLPVKTQQVAAGTYMVRLVYGNKIKATRLVKL